LIALLLATGGAAQPVLAPPIPVSPAPMQQAPAPASFCEDDRSPIACQDTLRALVVFVRFDGDDTWGPEWPNADAAGNPIPTRRLPPFARDILAPTPEAVAATTPEDSSLSAYFYWQSRNGPRGPHVLFGDVWPRNAQGEPEVYVTAPGRPNHYYHRDAGRGYGYLTQEILDALTASPGFDIGDYDHNQDRVVDHLFLVVKQDAAFRMEGWASLAGYGAAGGRPRQELWYWSPSRRDSVRVDWSWSGSQNLMANWANRKLLAHEYGHRLFGMPGHTPVIGLGENDVPLVVPATDGEGRHACAYNRMCGAPLNYDDAAWTLSGYELRRMGWAARIVLDPAAGDRRGLTIRPLYTSGEVVLVPLRPGSAGDTLSVESRQRNNFFDRYPPLDLHRYRMDTVWRELGTTGLLVTLSRGSPTGRASRYAYDVLPPDNQFDRRTRCSGPRDTCYPRDLYDGDMLRPGVATQLSPWTRPNTSGYTRYPPGFEPNWFALTNVRYTGGADATMAFDFDADVRDGFTITSDSWMGGETSGVSLTGLVVVAGGATLTVEAGAAVTFGAGLRVEQGARLVVEEGAEVRFGPGHRLVLLGRLEGGGVVQGR
jgi:hypothetical protein